MKQIQDVVEEVHKKTVDQIINDEILVQHVISIPLK